MSSPEDGIVLQGGRLSDTLKAFIVQGSGVRRAPREPSKAREGLQSAQRTSRESHFKAQSRSGGPVSSPEYGKPPYPPENPRHDGALGGVPLARGLQL
jgi:hypothetical protein